MSIHSAITPIQLLALPWTKMHYRFEEHINEHDVEFVKTNFATSLFCLQTDPSTSTTQIYLSLYSEDAGAILQVQLRLDVRTDTGLVIACQQESYEAGARGEPIDLAALDQLHLSYKRCNSAHVTATGPAPRSFIERLSSSAGLMVRAHAEFNEPIAFLISLAGYNEALLGPAQNEMSFALPPSLQPDDPRVMSSPTNCLKSIADHFVRLSQDV